MGQVDTTLKYGGYNTYRLDPNEEMHASMFDVSLYSDVTIQVVTINPASLASGSVHLCWIDGDNKRIGNIVVESVSVLKRFTEWWKAFEVPENAVRLHWWIKAGSTGFNFGCAMATPGTIRRAFSSNLEDRVSMITADGLYTSTISGNQILAGIIRALTGDAWFDLEKPEIVMKGTDVDLYITPNNPLKLTDKDGNFIGGVTRVGNDVFISVEALTSADAPDFLMKTGQVTLPTGDNGRGINISTKDPSDQTVRAMSIGIQANEDDTISFVTGTMPGQALIFFHNKLYSVHSVSLQNQLSNITLNSDDLIRVESVKGDPTYQQEHQLERAGIQLHAADAGSSSPGVLSIYKGKGFGLPPTGGWHGAMIFYEDEIIISQYDGNTHCGTLGIDSDYGPYVIRKDGTSDYL